MLIRAQKISRLQDADFKVEVRGLLDANEALSLKEQREFRWTDADNREGLHGAFFCLQMTCKVCGVRPTCLEPPSRYDSEKDCDNCGGLKPQKKNDERGRPNDSNIAVSTGETQPSREN